MTAKVGYWGRPRPELRGWSSSVRPQPRLLLLAPHRPHPDLDHDKAGLAEHQILGLSSYALRDWTAPPSPGHVCPCPVGPTREGCAPVQWPGDGPALNIRSGASV